MDGTPPVLVAVEIPLVGDERHKNWAKVVDSVDDTKSSGWAFEGEFIAAGGIQDVPVGSVIVVYGERGSRASPQSQAQILVANSDGTLTAHASARGRAWARTRSQARPAPTSNSGSTTSEQRPTPQFASPHPTSHPIDQCFRAAHERRQVLPGGIRLAFSRVAVAV